MSEKRAPKPHMLCLETLCVRVNKTTLTEGIKHLIILEVPQHPLPFIDPSNGHRPSKLNNHSLNNQTLPLGLPGTPCAHPQALILGPCHPKELKLDPTSN